MISYLTQIEHSKSLAFNCVQSNNEQKHVEDDSIYMYK